MAYHPVTTVPFLVGPDKLTPTTRYNRGVTIATQSPQSQLYVQHADLKVAADAVGTSTTELKTLLDAHTNAEASLRLARTALANGVVAWDHAYGVFVTTGEKYAASANDVHGLGAVPRGKTNHPLAIPLGVLATWDAKNSRIRVHVHRAPGMDAVLVEMSPDPVTPTSWFELPGSGAVQLVPNPAKGTWWFRACSLTAHSKSDFTTPTSVIVK